MPERSQAALDLLSAEVGRFSQLVEDLLEISRYDAGAVRLELDEIRLAEFIMQAVRASGTAPTCPSSSTASSHRSSCRPTSGGSPAWWPTCSTTRPSTPTARR